MYDELKERKLNGREVKAKSIAVEGDGVLDTVSLLMGSNRGALIPLIGGTLSMGNPNIAFAHHQSSAPRNQKVNYQKHYTSG